MTKPPKSNDTTDTVIIGGGFAGLSAAHTLLKNGIRPLILEKGVKTGGTAASYTINDFQIEKYYHHFFTHDSEVISLAGELGTDKELFWNETTMGFFPGEKLYNITTPLDFMMRFDHVGILDRLSFALFTFLAKWDTDYKALDAMNAEEWLNKRIGSSAYVKIAEPLIRAKFGVHISDISAAFLKGRLEARVRSRNLSMHREKLGYYRGGVQNLVSKLTESIQERGGLIRLDTEVETIDVKRDFDFTVKTTGGESFECSNIIMTTPVPVMEKLLGEYPGRVPIGNGFKYRSVVCLLAGITKPLSDYYWINIASSDIPFGVIVEHTNLVAPSNYNGQRLVYLSRYCDESSPVYKMDDDAVFDSYMSGLKKIFPGFRKDSVSWWRVSREPYSTPVFTKNFYRLIEDLESRLPGGVHPAGNLLTYPKSRNISNVIGSGRQAAEVVAREYCGRN